ncbi:MAG: hypothetical protein ACRDL6_10885 [Solirubrobacterales bacterium]
MLPATAAAGDGPTATKSGVLVNYVSTGKLKIAKKMTILVVCASNCNVDTTTVIKGPRTKLTSSVAGPLTAGQQGGPFFKPNRPLLRLMKAEPGKFKIDSSITATNAVTGGVETITRTFRLKR